MTEIKFRAWDNDNKKMVYNVQPNEDGTASLCVSKGFARQYDPQYKKYPCMQFTGLKDKNGLAEIYEGDIVTQVEFARRVKGEVVYSKASFIMRVKDSHDSPLYGGESCLVVGNVYENHELPKGVKDEEVGEQWISTI